MTTFNISEFESFVKLFNKINKTNYPLKKAQQNNMLLDLFDGIQGILIETASDISNQIKTSKSSKRQSYDKLSGCIPELDQDIFVFIYNNPKLSRQQISDKSGHRLQSVCSAVNRLMNAKLVFVCGTTIDVETNRTVEVLEVGNV